MINYYQGSRLIINLRTAAYKDTLDFSTSEKLSALQARRREETGLDPLSSENGEADSLNTDLGTRNRCVRSD